MLSRKVVALTVLISYGYVAAGFVCTAWVLGWQALVVGSHRTKSGIKYPQREFCATT